MLRDPDSIELKTHSLEVAYGGRPVVSSLEFELSPGKITALIGPNGSGKSTLLKALARVLKPVRGQVVLNGEDIRRLPTVEVARRLSLLPQGPPLPEGLTVAELVEYGRFPYQSMLGSLSREDRDAVDRAIGLVRLDKLRESPVDQLSGGQRQRAWIAMAVAQDTALMLLDEPTTFLDIAHQIEVLALVQRLNRDTGRSVLMVLHDLNLAARYADVLVVLNEGRIVASGPPALTLTEDMLGDVFRIDAQVFSDPQTGRPWFIPLQPIGAEGETHAAFD